jgi:transcriptional regulator with XRE-family HTH domain
MIIGERLKALRESKNLSQGDVEQRTGLLRCYTSRVENGHTVPSVETLEKYARALGVPLHQLFYEDHGTAKPLHLPRSGEPNDAIGQDEWRKFVKQLSKLSDGNRKTLYFMAQKMARPRRIRRRSGRRSSPVQGR